ncbi:acetyltransferase, GNAT family [Labilithrix luteola]|uniref:Acetyltransferase, GNAT family n=1 Tax=Labilithrix luteola TaxID=1391654 RepID=A0A0K1PPK4_9BACT|nr:GNAT family N-acetyltransferase [Labilithrix luteola]AKU95453.1 acetyltransferase, GNAT family [Labilithrix luteola]
MTPILRRALPSDVVALSEVGKTTFVETFGHLYKPEDLAAFLEHAYSLERTSRDLANPDKASWIVESGSEVIGYALAGPCGLPHPEVKPEDGELNRLYMKRGHQSGGLGSRMCAEALAWLESVGRHRIWIGVWSENFGAQRFYGRLGFEKVGEYLFPVGETRDLEFILRRG